MTHLETDPLTLAHVAITLVAIISGFVVLAQLLKSRWSAGWTGVFLAMSVLTSVTGFVFFHPPHAPTPAQLTGGVALVILLPTLYGLYLAHLRGLWRPVYVVGVVISLWLNVFVGVIQSFQKIPSPFQFAEGAPPGGPVFGAVEMVVLVLFVIAGWCAVKRFHPITA